MLKSKRYLFINWAWVQDQGTGTNQNQAQQKHIQWNCTHKGASLCQGVGAESQSAKPVYLKNFKGVRRTQVKGEQEFTECEKFGKIAKLRSISESKI